MSVDSRKELTNGKYIDDQMANGVPAGGTTGQVLKKNSNSDYDLIWGAGGGGSGGGGTVEQINTEGLISGGPINVSGTISTNMNTNKLVGRYNSGTGIMQEITLGNGVSIDGGVLNISGVTSGAALTKINDTNVTLSLGGSPTTALLAATSLTLGWQGTLAYSRGGTGLGYLGSANQLLRVNSGATALEYFTPSFESTSNKNQASGYAGLDSNGELLTSQVKGVLQYANFAAFPATGDQYRLYIDQSTRLHYYWNPNTTTYVKIGSFLSDFTVYLDQTAGFKTFLKWKNTENVPAAGLHPQELLKLGAQDIINPTATVSASPASYPYYTTSISNTIAVTRTLNGGSTSFTSVLLEWKRANENSTQWKTTGISPAANTFTNSYTHTDTNTITNTNAYNYRYTVVDNLGGTITVTDNVTISGYSAPTTSSFSTGSSGLTREYGNIASSISFTINKNSVNIPLVSYDLQFLPSGGSWTSILQNTISGNPSSVAVSYSHTPGIQFLNSTSIQYRVLVVDSLGSTTINLGTINFYIKRTFGYNANTTLIVSDIIALNASTAISNSMPLTITGVTAGDGLYTYYAYSSDAADINNIVLDDVENIYTSTNGGAFTKLANVTGTNSYGATVTYKVYKSNAPKAFTNNKLTIT